MKNKYPAKLESLFFRKRETKQRFGRLIKSGYCELDAKKYIGQCVAVELFNVMNYRQPLDEKRYVQNLLNLPKGPFDWEL